MWGFSSLLRITALCALAVTISACAGSSRYGDTRDVDTMTAGVSYTDVTKLSDSIIRSLLTSDFVTRYEKPVTISMLEIKNKTSEFVDTDALFGDKIRDAIINSGGGTFEFVDRSMLEETLREAELGEDGLVAGNEATQLGKAAGARLLMSGELSSIRAPGRDQDQRYYKLALRLVDTERNTIVWTKNEDIVKMSKKGWMQ